MTVDPLLLAEVRRDEGCRLVAYPDPLSPRGKALALPAALRPSNWSTLSGAPWTIGCGHTGPEVHEGLTWTQSQADAALAADVALHNALVARVMPWSAKLDAVRLRVLQNMCFNMGWDNPRTPQLEGLSGFRNFLSHVQNGEWALAAVEMLKSRWAVQVGERASRLARMMQTGRAGLVSV